MRHCTLFLMLAVFSQCYIESLQVWSGVRCPAVRLANGRVKARARGRIIRFSCFDGFTLVGNKYSTCVRGQWDTPIPVCVNSKCPIHTVPEHALVAPKYNGAILIYFCEPGYTLIGTPEIYCDGRQWNGTAPQCRDTNAKPSTSCDFEKQDLCWWEQDPHHDFDWRRQNFETPSWHIGTGPSHDHTLGAGNDGYYLYIEASGRLMNDTARIISPLYNSSYTENGCFSFWYHMYGATIGSLRLFLKPENESSIMLFNLSGDQGNQWKEGRFQLPKTDKDFQIIIEGVRGSSYVSDIAVDDVAILQGEECTKSTTEVSPVTDDKKDQVEIVNAMQTCRGRCEFNYITPSTLKVPIHVIEKCSCTFDCVEDSSCCPDYAEFCVLALTEEPTTRRLNNLDETNYGTKIIPAYPKDELDPNATTPSIITTKEILRMTKKPEKNVTRTTVTKRTTPRPETRETPFRTASTVVFPADEPNRTFAKSTVEVTKNTSIPLYALILVVIGAICAVGITTMISIVIVRRRKSYKRGTNGSALSDDSDVRFLTSDEILDFNLARPSDHDETQ
ncbi:uncharacterized protein [Prorops nasuta]|uniref:uncharacterized protein n=1 Tax=Prorops nasuta TaxID=863751 RepID=UPI0034CF55EE